MACKPPGSTNSAPWAKHEPGAGQHLRAFRRALHVRQQPIEGDRPRHTTTRRFASRPISRSSHGAQLRSSSGVGLLAGGAQRPTDVIQRSVSFMPSSRELATGCEAKPASYSTGNKKSPDPSPVNGLPVRFDPCAPGASPRARTRAWGSPNEGTGRPQYSQSRVSAAPHARHFSTVRPQPAAAIAGHNLGVQKFQSMGAAGA